MTNYRSTLDVNREKGEAAQSCPNAEIAYEIYHNKIQSLIDGFAQGKGLLFDMHGQVCETIFKDEAWKIKFIIKNKFK